LSARNDPDESFVGQVIEWEKKKLTDSVDESDMKEVAAMAIKQRYEIRQEYEISMREHAKSVESMVSMLSTDELNHREESIELILSAMRVAYRFGVDVGWNLPLKQREGMK